MTETVSSAGQLYNIIKEALSQDPDKQALHVWAEVLKVDNVDYEPVSNKLAELFGLFNDAKQDILQLEQVSSEIGISAISKIQTSIIRYGLDFQWSHINNQISEGILNNIKLCDNLLRSQGIAQNNIVKEEIPKLLDKVDNLIKEFDTSSLPNNFKLDLIGELSKLRDALINFDIRGEVHLQHICNEIVSDIITKNSTNPELFKKFQPFVQKTLSIVITIGGLMSTVDLSAKYLPSLTDNIINLIENISDESDDSQSLLKSSPDCQEMNAKIDNDSNYKALPYKEEE
ncbi:MAG: hypothetical protein RLZZ04_3894 [Cyanobacteriota bacterium]|jgi:hypothetical protein